MRGLKAFAAQLVALTFPHKHTEGLRGPGVQREHRQQT